MNHLAATSGYWAVALVLISGCINALVMVPHPGSLIGSDYGRALLVKLAFVVLLVAVAIFNRVVLTPPLMAAKAPDHLRPLWRSVVVANVPQAAGNRSSFQSGDCSRMS